MPIHLAGTLSGDVPAEWLEARRLIPCLVCALSVSERYGGYGAHPTCRLEARAAAIAASDTMMEVDGLPLPSLGNNQSARTPSLRHVPAATRHAWGQIALALWIWLSTSWMTAPWQGTLRLWLLGSGRSRDLPRRFEGASRCEKRDVVHWLFSCAPV